ncbi:MAG TPA: hypothetical protein VEC16_06770, partial [Alphaproteobacteria bacterium]|nr:hypothetical protein [Alphaproteobacteria bacterium]
MDYLLDGNVRKYLVKLRNLIKSCNQNTKIMKKDMVIGFFSGIILLGLLGFLIFNNLNFDSSSSEIQLEDTVYSKHWNRIFTKAFEPVDCPALRDPATLPQGYYKGPMVDTHIHFQSLPDGAPGSSYEDYAGNNIGVKKSVDEWACMLNVEGTKQAWVFFPVWEPIIDESIKLGRETNEKYPNRFVLFIMPPDDDGNPKGYPTVDAEMLQEMLEINPALFTGYGEI